MALSHEMMMKLKSEKRPSWRASQVLTTRRSPGIYTRVAGLLFTFGMTLSVARMGHVCAQENMIQVSSRKSSTGETRRELDLKLEDFRDQSQDALWSKDQALRIEPEDRTKLDQSDRIRAIQDQIRMLEKIMKEKQQQSSANSGQGVDSPDSASRLPANKLRNRELAEPGVRTAPLPGSEANDSVSEQEAIGFPAELSVPVDARELANSLFLSGNWQDALAKYEFYLANDPSRFQQDAWAKYGLANCYRMMGDWSRAETYYRDVVASQTQSYPGMMSGWYLSYLSQRKQMTSDFEALEVEASQYVQSIGARDE